jgi:hypothetical protein
VIVPDACTWSVPSGNCQCLEVESREHDSTHPLLACLLSAGCCLQADLREAFFDPTVNSADVTRNLRKAMSQIDVNNDGGISLYELVCFGLGGSRRVSVASEEVLSRSQFGDVEQSGQMLADVPVVQGDLSVPKGLDGANDENSAGLQGEAASRLALEDECGLGVTRGKKFAWMQMAGTIL